MLVNCCWSITWNTIICCQVILWSQVSRSYRFHLCTYVLLSSEIAHYYLLLLSTIHPKILLHFSMPLLLSMVQLNLNFTHMCRHVHMLPCLLCVKFKGWIYTHCCVQFWHVYDCQWTHATHRWCTSQAHACSSHNMCHYRYVQ